MRSLGTSAFVLPVPPIPPSHNNPAHPPSPEAQLSNKPGRTLCVRADAADGIRDFLRGQLNPLRGHPAPTREVLEGYSHLVMRARVSPVRSSVVDALDASALMVNGIHDRSKIDPAHALNPSDIGTIREEVMIAASLRVSMPIMLQKSRIVCVLQLRTTSAPFGTSLH